MEDYVTYEQAVKLKELGFDWECNHLYSHRSSIDFIDLTYYNDFNTTDSSKDYSAPTLAQVQKWLREKHNIIILVETYFKNYMDGDYSKVEFEYVIVSMNLNAARKSSSQDDKLFGTYEQALSCGIDKSLELLELLSKN